MTTDNLNAIMEFERVIMVANNGTVTFPEMRGPYELYTECDAEGMHTDLTWPALKADVEAEGWELLSGWSGQNSGRYAGPFFHDSEFIGGALADHILETPGYWVATVCYTENVENPEEGDSEIDSWIVCRKDLPDGLKVSA